MRKKTFVAVVQLLILSASLTACKDTRTVEKNERLKARVAELQRENGESGDHLEKLTAQQDALVKEKTALRQR